jgi:predicted small lipoprotein YifL
MLLRNAFRTSHRCGTGRIIASILRSAAMLKNFIRALPFLFAACALVAAGCGQKGPLYLPPDKTAQPEPR